MSELNATLAQTWFNIQTSLFPWLSEELGELTEKQQELHVFPVHLFEKTGQAIHLLPLSPAFPPLV